MDRPAMDLEGRQYDPAHTPGTFRTDLRRLQERQAILDG